MTDYFSLEKKNILITGASSGIGRQCAISCSESGANVILIGRDPERIKITMDLLKGENNLYYSQDITDYTSISKIIEEVVNKMGKISGFIHSAGTELTLPFRETKPSILQDIFSLNTIAGFEVARIVAQKRYVASTGGSFVFISSIMGIIGAIGKVAYCCSKGAVIAGVKAMALELASKNIRVNTISPAIVKTDMTKKLFANISEDSMDEIIKNHPLGLGQPFDVAMACIYLLSDASKWVTATNLIVDGGYSAK